MERASEGLTPSEMAEECDVTVDTLRYYERERLLAPGRTQGNQRRYSAADVAWVKVLRCLRVTAMPVRDMRRFAELVRQGDAGIPGRIDLLRAHRTQVMEQVTALEDALATIDHKIAVYAEALDATPDADTGGIATMPTLGGQGARL